MPSTISLVKCNSYNQEEIFSAVQKAVNLLGGMSIFVKPGQRVLLKVSMLSSACPEEGITTHPAVLHAVAKLVKEAGGIPFAGDSPGAESGMTAAESCGYKNVCDELGIPFVELKTEKEIKNPSAIRFKSIIVSKDAHDADVIINLPKFKTHNFTGITAAVKNMFGCIPGLLKSQYHAKIQNRENFCLLLLDIIGALKPSLSIVDAVVAMEGEGGPTAGTLKKLNFVAASADPIALDETLCQAININPNLIPTIKMAKKYSLLRKSRICGEKIENIRCKDFKTIPLIPYEAHADLFHRWLRHLVVERPELIKKKCSGCRICHKVCQSRCISFKNNLPVYDYEKCIRCFCCAEMCPEKAIKVKRGLLQKHYYFFLKNGWL